MQCNGTNKTGNPCGRPAIRGGNVCPLHGGSAPQVRDAARRRLLEAADPVAAELVRLALKADSESVRAQAARDILDRAGYGAKQHIEQEVTVHGEQDAFAEAVKQLEHELARSSQSRSTMEANETPPPNRT